MPLPDPQLSTGEDSGVKEIHKLSLNEDVSYNINKQYYNNFYNCLEPLEGNDNNNKSDSDQESDTNEDIPSHDIMYRINTNTKKKDVEEQEDTWFLPQIENTTSDEEDTSAEVKKIKTQIKKQIKDQRKSTSLSPEQKRIWMDNHTREKNLPMHQE